MSFKLLKSILIVVMIFVSLVLLNANLVLADDDQNSVSGLLETSGEAAKYNVADIKSGKINMATIVGQIIQIFLSLLGAIFIGLMIYGGYTWMMARGNDEDIKKARDLIMSAVIGLVIVIASYAISYFVLYYFTQGYFQTGTTGF